MKADDCDASGVGENLRFLEQAGVWHLRSTNPEVRSCREAAENRWRLGDRGIPLCDELKSAIGKVTGPQARYVAVHCRGHQYIDDAKLERLLGGEFRRLGESELRNEFGLEYGRVTPFGLARAAPILQLFDQTLLERYFAPYTMMTNLGSLTEAVELEIRELYEALPDTRVADVVRDGDAGIPREHTVGILTGNGPESGMLLWEFINESIRTRGDRRFRGDVAFPRVVVESVPTMGLSMELPDRLDEVRPVVLGGAERLCRAGASVVGIACNTTQYFGQDVAAVCAEHGAEFVSLVDETAARLRRERVTSCDFFGISAVSDFGGWSAFTPLQREVELVRPPSREVEQINAVAFSVKQRGIDGRAVNRLRDLVNNAARTETIVIALTELSAVLRHHPKNKGDKRIVDTLEVLGAAIADRVLAERNILDVPPLADGMAISE